MNRQTEKNRPRLAGLPRPEPSWAFFFDIDGTLLAIAATPTGVTVDSRLKQTLEQLRTATGGAIALISGRRIAEVDRLFAPLHFATAGQHGIERRDGSAVVHHYAAPSYRLGEIKNRLAPLLARHPGLLLEEKGLTLAIHYRQAPSLGGHLHRLLRELVNSAEDLRLQPGKMVLEIIPMGSDKGGTIIQFMSEIPFRGRIPVFLGDDVTDEYGFSVVNALGGHSIKVGPGQSAARWRLPDVHAVRSWLEQCANTLAATEPDEQFCTPSK
jgi:trehalose 6-phosphate phosphatase